MKRLTIALTALIAAFAAEAKTVWTYSVEGKQAYITDESGWKFKVQNVTIGDVTGIGTAFSGRVSVGTDGELDFSSITDAEGNSYTFIQFGGYEYQSGPDTSLITSINAPDCISVIGGYNFGYSCYALTSVTLNENVVEIGDRAFMDCKALVNFYPTTCPKLKTVGSYAFGGSRAAYVLPLTGIDFVFPALETVGGQAFYRAGCRSITALKLVSVGKQAFAETKFGGDWDEPDLLTVGDFAWQSSGIQGISMPKVQSIGASAFNGCASLTNVVVGEDLKTLGQQAFYNCTALTSFSPLLPANMTSIGDMVFDGCQALSGELVYDCPDLLTVPPQLVRNCYGLTNLIVKTPVSALGAGCFANIKNSPSIYFYGPCPAARDITSLSCAFSARYKIYCKEGTEDSWKADGDFSALGTGDSGYPKKTFGKLTSYVKAGGNASIAWLASWREKQGLVIILR